MDRLPVVGPLKPALLARPTRDTLLRGMLVFRWLTLVWILGTYVYEVWERSSSKSLLPNRVIERVPVAHPVVGFVLFGALIAIVLFMTWSYFTDPVRLLQPFAVLSEIAVCASLLGLDIWVYGATDHAQALLGDLVVAQRDFR